MGIRQLSFHHAYVRSAPLTTPETLLRRYPLEYLLRALCGQIWFAWTDLFITGDFTSISPVCLQSFHKTRKPFTIICGSEQTATFQKKLFDQMNEIGSAHHMNEGLKFSAAYVQIATVGMTRSLLPLFGM